jgi:hypothetical protein
MSTISLDWKLLVAKANGFLKLLDRAQLDCQNRYKFLARHATGNFKSHAAFRTLTDEFRNDNLKSGQVWLLGNPPQSLCMIIKDTKTAAFTVNSKIMEYQSS